MNGLFRGDYGTTPKRKLPSYIPARNFAMAVIEVKENRPALAAAGAALPANVTTAFTAIEKAADNNAAKIQAGVEDWFNSAMDRVSG